MKRKLILAICAILSLLVLFCGCTVKEDSEESRTLCETMLDHIIQNDYEAAFSMVSNVGSEEDFAYLWNEMRSVLQNSKSYELKQKSWYQRWTNGVTTTEVLFEVVTDDGKVCQFTIYTTDQIEGIAGLHFLDSTAFIQKTEFLSVVNIFLLVFSLICMAFSIWMLIDCLKRRLQRKILWALLTILHVGFSLTMGASAFNFKFRISLLNGISTIAANHSTLAIAITAFLPIGAIVYFFMRKRLTISEEPKAEEIPAQGNGETEELFDQKKEETEA